MAFCANCGYQLLEGAKFCPVCGTKTAAPAVAAPAQVKPAKKRGKNEQQAPAAAAEAVAAPAQAPQPAHPNPMIPAFLRQSQPSAAKEATEPPAEPVIPVPLRQRQPKAVEEAPEQPAEKKKRGGKKSALSEFLAEPEAPATAPVPMQEPAAQEPALQEQQTSRLKRRAAVPAAVPVAQEPAAQEPALQEQQTSRLKRRAAVPAAEPVAEEPAAQEPALQEQQTSRLKRRAAAPVAQTQGGGAEVPLAKNGLFDDIDPEPDGNPAEFAIGAKAALAYCNILFLVPLLTAKESRYARFHAIQGFNLFLLEVAGSLLFGLLGLILGASLQDAFLSAMLITLLSAVFGLICAVLAVIGLTRACRGQMKQLPVIGGIRIIK